MNQSPRNKMFASLLVSFFASYFKVVAYDIRMTPCALTHKHTHYLTCFILGDDLPGTGDVQIQSSVNNTEHAKTNKLRQHTDYQTHKRAQTYKHIHLALREELH